MTNPDTDDSLRVPDFSKRVWGYDAQEVDAFMAELDERLERARREGLSAAPVVELSGVGEKVEEILAAAREAAGQTLSSSTEVAAALKRESEEAAEQIRREADEYARSTRGSADEYDAATRSEADREAGSIREQADAAAEAKVAAAEEEAESMLRDARLELGRIEDSIEDLRERRQLVITSIERLRGSLGSMVGEASQGTTEYAAIAEETAAIEQEDEELTAPLEVAEASDDDELAEEVADLALPPAHRNGASDDGAESYDEYETGEWETEEEATEAETDEEEATEAETRAYRYADVNGDTEEQRIRGEDL